MESYEGQGSGLIVALRPVGTINYAMYHNNIPVLTELVIENTGGSELREIEVTLECEPEFARVWTTSIDVLPPGSQKRFENVDLRLSHEMLAGLAEQVPASMTATVRVSGEVATVITERLRLLAYNEWQKNSGLPEILAAFVLPNAQEVQRILTAAFAVLREWTGDSSLTGYQTRERGRVLLTAEAIYTTVQSLGFAYANPPASFETTGQKIRLPEEIFQAKLGTCLDLTLLLAGCLEQAGLHPLLVLTRSHAFVGLWLDETDFPTAVVDDVLPLRKRVDLQEICVFEATYSVGEGKAPFKAAISNGREHLTDNGDFELLVDVCRARRAAILPLPTRAAIAAAAEAQVNEGESGRGSSTDSGPSTVGIIAENSPNLSEGDQTAGATKEARTRLDVWKTKLLDLSLNNKLLNFKETKKTVSLLCPDVASLEDALAEGVTLKVQPAPREFGIEDPRKRDILRQRSGTDGSADFLRQELEAKRLHSSLEGTELSHRLLEIYREARSSREENGVNTLYIALGFLSWYETDSSDMVRKAPIVLIPLEIERPSIQEGFRVRMGTDEPMVNTTLLQKLAQSFEVNVKGVDPIPQDDSGIDLRGVLRKFREAVKEIPRWEVTDEAWVGLFSFRKYLMWKDLESRTEDLVKNSVVAQLMGVVKDAPWGTGTFPDSDTLDDTHEPQETFCPLSADSSQLASVYAAADGRSFVLHGPPGTGKSQTITNMISNLLAAGKTVLFVSEKQAALGVVKTRLEKVGLGPFCLELHSNKANKQAVLQRLGQTLDMANRQAPTAWDETASNLRTMRNELNSYVRAMHQIRQLGESVFNCLSRLIGLRDVPDVDLSWDGTGIKFDKIKRDQLQVLKETANHLQEAASHCEHPSSSVWSGVGHDDWSPVWMSSAQGAIIKLDVTLRNLRETAVKVAARLGMPMGDWSFAELEAMAEVAGIFLELPIPTPELITAPEWNELDESISEWISRGQKRDVLKAGLDESWSLDILELNHNQLLGRLREADGSWSIPRWIGLRKIRKFMARFSKPGMQVTVESIEKALTAAGDLKREERHLLQSSDKVRGVLGRFWRNGDSDWVELSRVRDSAVALRSVARRLAGNDTQKAMELRRQWAGLMGDARDDLNPDGPIGSELSVYREAITEFSGARTALTTILSLDNNWWPPEATHGYCAQVADKTQAMSAGLANLRAWCYWRKARKRAGEAKLSSVIRAYEAGIIRQNQIYPVLEKAFYKWWTENVISAEPVLKNFFSPAFENLIQRFRDTDDTYMGLASLEVQARLAGRLPNPAVGAASGSEMSVLKKELGKKKNHMAIRSMIQKIPNLLTRITPCLLMSPISVAQYLDPAHPAFDVVIFDEASQIPTWDAVGAMARGKEVIIVGDPRQLPPTNFFDKSDDGLPEDDMQPDLDSILDDAIAASVPQMRLKWHYRSRHESLIAFSNKHYYDNTLLTFPSPYQGRGVTFQWVGGSYGRGTSRTNLLEARAIVDAIVDRLKDSSGSKSIGVVTFGQPQQVLIEDMLEEARAVNPEIEPYFSDSSEERVFVKNLENVQGDERDVIMFSICYSPDSRGVVPINFGPLNKSGGERRLNVAITRAREEVVVFASLRGGQIDTSRSRAEGVRHLRYFLEYAEKGPSALASEVTGNAFAECESPFEEQVKGTLEAKGYQVHAQVGCSGYRIDLAVVDPKEPGRYIIGIECDGVNYHSARTARDRDKLREAVLRELGWKLHRIWSTDWWERPQDELEKAMAAIEKARSYENVIKEPSKLKQTTFQRIASFKSLDSNRANVVEASPSTTPFRPAPMTSVMGLEPYRPYTSQGQMGKKEDFYLDSVLPQIRAVMTEVIEAEGPISINLLFDKAARAWGIARMGSKVQEQLTKAMGANRFTTTKSSYGKFVWPKGVASKTYTAFRVHGDAMDDRRDVADISPHEYANGALHVLNSQVSLPMADLVRETAKLFGYKSGSQVTACVAEGVKLLILSGRACERGGMIVLV